MYQVYPAQQRNWTGARFGRVLGGLFAGSVFGLLAEVILFQDEPPEHRAKLILGAAIGAVLLAVLALMFGGHKLPGWFNLFSVTILGGVLVGALAGAFVYAEIMTRLDPLSGIIWSKVHSGYQAEGVLFGMPIGAALGLLAGTTAWLWKRRRVSAMPDLSKIGRF